MPRDKRDELEARDVDLSIRTTSDPVVIAWFSGLKWHTRKGCSVCMMPSRPCRKYISLLPMSHKAMGQYAVEA